MIDKGQVGRVSMALLDRLEEDYGPDAELIQFACLVEVRYPDEDNPEQRNTTVQWEYENSSVPQLVGLLVSAIRGLLL